MALLSIKNLTKNFGGLCANSNISMEIDDGELVGLIGPNGAGKTTLFNMLTGVYEPSEGTIDFVRDGKEVRLNGKKPYVVTALGLARTFQNIRLFQNLSVIDNVKIAMNKDVKCGVVASILRFPMFFKEEERIEKEALELLDILHLADKKDE